MQLAAEPPRAAVLALLRTTLAAPAVDVAPRVPLFAFALRCLATVEAALPLVVTAPQGALVLLAAVASGIAAAGVWSALAWALALGLAARAVRSATPWVRRTPLQSTPGD